MYNILSNLEYCGEIVTEMSGVLLYTHVPPAIIALFLGVYVLFRTRNRQGAILFAMAATFTVWVTLALLTWFTFDQNAHLITIWSMFGLLSAWLFFLTQWFVHNFIVGTRFPSWMVTFWGLLFIPLMILTPTALNLSGVDVRDCVAVEGEWFTLYYHSLGIIAMILMLVSAYIGFRKQKNDSYSRSAKILVVVGAELFVLAFLTTSILASYLVGSGLIPDFGLEQYGVATMTVFMAILAYATVRYHAFNLKLLGAQALVIGLIALIAAELLFVQSQGNRILVLITLALAIGFGFLLVKSVKKEVEQREEIQRKEQELELANREQESLLHFISHEIKGYLTKSEAGFASIADGSYGAVSKELQTMSESALGEMRKGVATVMDILDASNLKKGTVSYKKDSFDFKKAVLDVVAQLQSSADEKGLVFDIAIKDGSFMVTGDEEKLKEHAIRNLVDNAIKYTPKGAVRIELARTDGHFRFSVQDNGVGITPEDMQRLFTEGGHGKDSLKINVHSTGYGLYIAKKTVEAHGGKIWAESDGGGKGSRFVVELPAA